MRHTGRLKLMAAGVGMSLITLTTAGLALSNNAFASQTMTPTTYLNLRSGPGTGHSVVTVLSPSQPVTTTGNTSGAWYEVTTGDGQTGWASGTYLKPTGSSGATGGSSSAPTASGSATTTSAVNVRSGPGTGYSVLTVAAKGTTLPTTGKTSGGWTEVIRDGQTAWISTSYLTDV